MDFGHRHSSLLGERRSRLRVYLMVGSLDSTRYRPNTASSSGRAGPGLCVSLFSPSFWSGIADPTRSNREKEGEAATLACLDSLSVTCERIGDPAIPAPCRRKPRVRAGLPRFGHFLSFLLKLEPCADPFTPASCPRFCHLALQCIRPAIVLPLPSTTCSYTLLWGTAPTLAVC